MVTLTFNPSLELHTVTVLMITDGVFGLVIGFIEFFEKARDYTSQFTITHTHTHSLVPSRVFNAVAW
jgi:hypothetical protein